MSALNRTVLQLYSVSLTRNEKNPDDHDVDTEAQAEAAAAETSRRGGGAAVPKVDVKIEWDGLDQRIRQLTHLGGSVADVVPSPDSRTYAVVVGGGTEDGPGLYTIGDDGTRLTRISTMPEGGGRGRGGAGGGGGGGFDPQWSKDGRSIYYMQGGGIYSVAAPAAPAAEAAVRDGGRGGRGGASGSGGGCCKHCTAKSRVHGAAGGR